MGKVVIEVPDWVSREMIKRRVEEIIIAETEKMFSKGRVDRETYKRFLKFYSKEENVELPNEEEKLKEIRKREKERTA